MSAKPVLLIVDDNELLRFANRLLFQRAGYTVVEAANGAQGLEQAHHQLPDVVLLDLRMPVLDGWQLVGLLVRDAKTADIPVVAYTAEEGPGLADRLRAAGFWAHAEKRIPQHELLDLVQRCSDGRAAGERWIERGSRGATPRRA